MNWKSTLETNEELQSLHMVTPHFTAGFAIGVIAVHLVYPKLPGNVANATTYPFPVLYKEVFFEIPKMDSSFVSQNVLFSILYEGIQCGNYLDSHTYIFEDVISDVSPLIFSRYRKTIVFVLANRLLYLYDTDYGIFDYRELPTKRAINCIKDLEVIANTKNPNNFCQKCGSRLAGFFSRRCPRCDK